MKDKYQAMDEERKKMYQEIKIKKIQEYVYEVEKQGKMRVPVRIFASEKILEKLKEDKSLEQGMNVATLPGILGASLMMPDAHQGYGCPVGGVAAFDAENGLISPGVIGFDVNCGVRLLRTNLMKEDVEVKIKELLELLFKKVPSGVGEGSKIKLTKQELDEVLTIGAKWALEKGLALEEDLEYSEENGTMPGADPKEVSNKAKERGKDQLGTLGAGNHFLEIQYVDQIYHEDAAEAMKLKKGQIVVMIHCGSRGLGHQVCSDFIRIMEEENPKLADSLVDRNLIYAPAESEVSKRYFKAMCAAANFAWCNRQIIAHNVREAFKEIFPKSKVEQIYDIAHNIAKLEEHKVDGEMKKVYLHRKGATRAFPPGSLVIPKKYRKFGQPIMIPGSMGTASYVLVGSEKAMELSFGSTAHGAGRVMSRNKAKELFRGEKVKADLEKQNIYIKAASWKGISEEAPLVYKDVDEVVKISDKVGIGKAVARFKPLGVVKG